MSSFLILTWNLLSPFSIKSLCYHVPFSIRKALLTQRSLFANFHGLYCPNSINKALLPHMISFLHAFTNPILYKKKTFVSQIWTIFCKLHALSWPNSVSKNHSYPIRAVFWHLHALHSHHSLSKPLVSSFLLTTCPSLTSVPAKKALLLHMSSFVLVAITLLAQDSVRETLLPHLSSFLLITSNFPG